MRYNILQQFLVSRIPNKLNWENILVNVPNSGDNEEIMKNKYLSTSLENCNLKNHLDSKNDDPLPLIKIKFI